MSGSMTPKKMEDPLYTIKTKVSHLSDAILLFWS